MLEDSAVFAIANIAAGAVGRVFTKSSLKKLVS
jgi:hypothetical protein